MPENTPLKFMISKPNEYMVKNSDYFICYVTHKWDIAAKNLEYAERQKEE